MNVLDNSTRSRVIGSTGAFATGGTALGGAVATIIYELFLPNLTPNGALALGVICSSILALLGSWAAPSKKAEVEGYLGSVLAMSQYGAHGKLVQPPSVSSVSVPPEVSTSTDAPAPTDVISDPAYEFTDTGGTEFTDPAYAYNKQ